MEKMLSNLASICCFRSNKFNISWNVRSFERQAGRTFLHPVTVTGLVISIVFLLNGLLRL